MDIWIVHGLYNEIVPNVELFFGGSTVLVLEVFNEFFVFLVLSSKVSTTSIHERLGNHVAAEPNEFPGNIGHSVCDQQLKHCLGDDARPPFLEWSPAPDAAHFIA